MDPLASADNPNPLFCVVIDSLGSATLNSAAAIARGLGVSAAQVVHCLYRAPAILADRLEAHLAEQLTGVLQSIGYDVRMIREDECRIAPAPLYDIAVYLEDVARLDEAAARLGKFIGMDSEEAVRAIITPPGLVLGGVSIATVEALRAHLGESLAVTAAPQEDAYYTLVLGDCLPLLRQRLLDDLRHSNITPLADQGVLATNLPGSLLQPLWNRHKTNTALRLVNTAFLRFDINLDQPPAAPLPLAARQLLEQLCDIPDAYLDEVLASAPVTLAESVTREALEQLLESLAPFNLVLSGELITFQSLGLTLESAADPSAAFKLLDQFALPRPTLNHQDPHSLLPYTLPQKLPEVQARLVRAALEQIGVSVVFSKD